MPRRTVEQRFWSYLDRSGEPDACWLWQGYRMPQGYGQFNVDGRIQLAHRFAWELTNGPIPDGLYVCHHCDNPPCCNQNHLFLGTQTDNMRDSAQKGHGHGGEYNAAKTRCIRGHLLSGKNLYTTAEGKRSCRICRLNSKRAFRLRKKAAVV